MAKKKPEKVHQAWVRMDWTKVPRTNDGGVWISLRKSGKSVGSFQVTQGAVYFFPSHAKKSKCKRLTFQKLAELFSDYGQDYDLSPIE